LARLGLARANALEARTDPGVAADAARTRALIAYREFFELWKDADPDIPILKQARVESATLQRSTADSKESETLKRSLSCKLWSC